MSLIKKSDVKNHLSARHQNRIHVSPVSLADATGFSGTNQAPVQDGRSSFNEDFTGDHTTAATTLEPSDEASATLAPQAHAGSGTS